MNLNETYPEFNEKLSKALKNVGDLKGLSYFNDFKEHGLEDGFMISGEYVDDYLLVWHLAQLIENGNLELKIEEGKSEYVLRLLHIMVRSSDIS